MNIHCKAAVSLLVSFAMLANQAEACWPLGSFVDRTLEVRCAALWSGDIPLSFHVAEIRISWSPGAVLLFSSSRSGGTLQDKAYQWDNLGNLTSRTDNVAKRLESFGYLSVPGILVSSQGNRQKPFDFGDLVGRMGL